MDKSLEGSVVKIGYEPKSGTLLKKIETNIDELPFLSESTIKALKRTAESKGKMYIAAQSHYIG